MGDWLEVGGELDVLADLFGEAVDNQLVRRLLLELQSEHLLEHILQVLVNQLEDLLGVLDMKTLLQEVFELIVLVLEGLVEV